jgi:periplasmic protein TonB
MLEDSLFESQPRKKSRNPITVILSVAAHVVTIAVLVLVPLLQTQALTIPPVDTSLLLPPAPTHGPITVFTAGPRPQGAPRVVSDALTTPIAIPQQIALTNDLMIPEPVSSLPPGFTGGTVYSAGRLPGGPIEIGPPVAPPPTPPPPPPTPVTTRIVRQSVLQAAYLIYQVKPVYPPIAIQTRTRGIVVLEAVIGKDGSVDQLRVISGHPLLTRAALDAVQQWKYRPTILGGDPVEVSTTVTVTFTLQ